MKLTCNSVPRIKQKPKPKPKQLIDTDILDSHLTALRMHPSWKSSIPVFHLWHPSLSFASAGRPSTWAIVDLPIPCPCPILVTADGSYPGKTGAKPGMAPSRW